MKKVTETEKQTVALRSFFRTTSTFNIRWKKTWRKDFISPGVYKDEFLDQSEGGYTRKEMKALLEAGLIQETSYTPRQGGRRAAIILKCYELPQVDRFKGFMVKWIEEALWVPYAFVGIVFVLALVIAFFVHSKRAFGFGPSITQTNLKSDRNVPGVVGYFDDTETGTRCYWMSETDRPAISCVPKAVKK